MAQQNIGKEPTQWVDSRCFGARGSSASAGLACVKFCDQNVSDPKQCSVNVQVGDQMRDIQEGQTCQDFGLQVCAWPDTWEPKPFPDSAVMNMKVTTMRKLASRSPSCC